MVVYDNLRRPPYEGVHLHSPDAADGPSHPSEAAPVFLSLYAYMASKTITVTESAYEKPVAHERDDESSSDVIGRLTSTSTDSPDSAGSSPNVGTAGEAAREEFEQDVTERDHELTR